MLEKVFFEGLSKSAFASLTKSSLEVDEHLMTSAAVSKLADTGLEVIDLQSDSAFARRRLHVRDVVSHIEGMNRLARIFADVPQISCRGWQPLLSICAEPIAASASFRRTAQTKTSTTG